MYYPIKLKATNFQSFENLDYNFQSGETLLVCGENLTDEGQENNGSGKSTFQEIIYYCLLGTSSTGKRDFKLIRWGEGSSKLELQLYNSEDKTTLIIERELFLKKSSSLKLSLLKGESGEDLRDVYSSVNDGNKLILDLLDISREDLCNFYLINREKFISFFSSPDSKKRELIGRFSSADRLLKSQQIIQKKAQPLLKQKDELQLSLSNALSKISVYEEQQVKILRKYNSEEFERRKQKIQDGLLYYNNTLNEKRKSLPVLEEAISILERSKDSVNTLYNCYEKAVKNLRKINFSSEIDIWEGKLSDIKKSCNRLKEDKSNNLTELFQYKEYFSKLKLIISSSVTCPSCKFEFSVDSNSDVSIEEAKELVQLTQQEILNIEKIIKDLETKISEIVSPQNKDYKEIVSRIDKLKSRDNKRLTLIRNYQSEMKILGSKIIYFEEILSKNKHSLLKYSSEEEQIVLTIKSLEKNLNELQNEVTESDKSLIDDLKIQVEKSNIQIKEYQNQSLIISDQINKLNIWEQNFKQFYTYVTNKSLSTIESHCNHFLEKINTSLQIKFEGFKTLSGGEIRENITAKIFRDGLEEEDYRCFSGGERGRLILSTILTFQHLINTKSKSGGLDLLFIDEILDQVDSEGMRNFIDSLSQLKRTIFLTSQVRTKEVDDGVVTIIKENGISKIK